jgi:hypothetical protein
MIYTRESPDPNPTKPMYDPDKIMCGTKEQASDPFYYLNKSMSLPKDDMQRKTYSGLSQKIAWTK